MLRSSNSLSSTDYDRLKSAIDEAAIVAITDAHGTIIYANQKFCAISQYNREELIGQNHRIINSGFHPKSFFIDMWKTIASGKTWEGEIRNRAKDGSYYWVNTTIVPFMDEKGKPERYVSVRYEITQRKMAEEQLSVYAKKLEISNQELQDFASVAAHDLQEPLRKVHSFAERLKLKAKEALNDEAKDYLERIQSSAQRMQNLINDLLAYSRVTTKAQAPSNVDLNQVFKQIVSDLEIRIQQNEARVEWRELPTLPMEPTQAYQLFQNLVSNALKFRNKDVAPHVEITSKYLADSTLAVPAYEISVKDNGIGFEEKYLDRVFTIFQRLHGRHEYEGTGIGLSLCRKIVDRHGGLITARSTPGQGATFVVLLPARLKERW